MTNPFDIHLKLSPQVITFSEKSDMEGHFIFHSTKRNLMWTSIVSLSSASYLPFYDFSAKRFNEKSNFMRT